MAVVGESSATDTAQAWTALTQQASEVTLRQTFSTPGKVELSQVTGDPVIGRITLTVAELIASGNWSRIRACANPLCNHVFYDTTRSRTQRWDSYEVCGNRANVAAYRARKSGRAGDDTADKTR
jgi:predicted RNA-binding Zn ribbon-like protein